MTDFSGLIEPVARELLGAPNAALSTKTTLRWGNAGSLAVYTDGGGNWRDFESGEQGLVLDLVMREIKTDKGGAVEWLERKGYLAAKDSATASQPARLREEPAEATDAKPKGQPVNVKRYPYTDGDGNVLYEVIRQQFRLPDGSWQLGKSGNPKKSFWQRRPDGAGGWINSLGDVQHTIFRRPAVEQAIAEGKTVYLAEGEKDVETLEAWGLVGTTNSGGAQNWRPDFAAFFKGADVVILGDDDEAGQKRVDVIGAALRGVAGRLRAVRSWGGPKDVTDWKAAGGDAVALSHMVAGLEHWRPLPPKSVMGAVGVHQLHDPDLRHEFVIDGFLDRQGVAMMPGASGSGKTFLVLEIAMCIATGRPFWGMAVKPGVVLYQAGEGKQGVTKRLDAWLTDRGVEAAASIPFQMLTKRVNLFADDSDTDAIIGEGKAWAAYYEQPIRLVVIDTFNKAITGANEISGQDMGKVLARMERISTELDCVVLSPIHKSKQGDMRGHTSLKGDASNVIEVAELDIRDTNERIIRTVSLDKNKDGEKGKPMRFVLRQVVLGEDENGKPITTCVVDRPNGDEAEYARQGKLTYPQIISMKALRQSIEDFGIERPTSIRAGDGVRRVVKASHWKDQLRKIWTFQAAEDEPEKRARELDRAIQNTGRALLAAEYIGRDNDLGVVWLTGKDDRPQRKAKTVEPPRPSPYMTEDDIHVPF